MEWSWLGKNQALNQIYLNINGHIEAPSFSCRRAH